MRWAHQAPKEVQQFVNTLAFRTRTGSKCRCGCKRVIIENRRLQLSAKECTTYELVLILTRLYSVCKVHFSIDSVCLALPLRSPSRSRSSVAQPVLAPLSDQIDVSFGCLITVSWILYAPPSFMPLQRVSKHSIVRHFCRHPVLLPSKINRIPVKTAQNITHISSNSHSEQWTSKY